MNLTPTPSLSIRNSLIPIRIAALYAIVGGLWILFSDQILFALVQDAATLSSVQTVKGWFYIVATSGTLYWLIRRDLTGVRQSAEALRESEEKYRTLFETSADAVLVETLDGGIIDCNAAACALFGYSRDELIGLHASELLDPDWADRMPGLVTRDVQDDRFMIEVVCKTREGLTFSADLRAWRAHLWGQPIVFIYLHSIAERKHAERVQAAIYAISETANTAENLHDLFRAIHDIVGELMPARNFYIALYDDTADVISWPYFVDEYDIAGPPHKPGRGLTEYVLRTGRPLLASPEVFDDLVAAGEVTLVGAPSIDWLGVPLKTKDRTIGVLTVQSYTEGTRYSLTDEDILMFVSGQVAMAIQRKQTEEDLRASEERYRTLVNNMPIGVYRTSPGPMGQFLMANPAFLRLFGFDREEDLAHVSVSDLYFNPDERKAFSDRVVAQGSVIGAEMRSRKRDGTALWSLVTARAVREEGTGAIAYFDCTMEDITERKRAEQAERDQRALAEALRDTAAALSRTLNLDEVLDCILDNIGRVVPYDAAHVMLVDAERGTARVACLRGYAQFGERVARDMAELSFDISRAHNLRTMAESGQPIVVADTALDPDGDLVAATAFARSWAGAPIMVDGRVAAFFSLDKVEPGFYQPQYAERLKVLADQAAIAIKNAQLFEEAQRRAQRLALINEISMAANLPLALDVVLQTAADGLAHVLGVGQTALALFDDMRRHLTIVAEHLAPGSASGIGYEIPLEGNASMERILATKAPLAIFDAQSDPLLANLRDIMIQRRVRSLLIVPFIVRDEIIGTVGADAIEFPRYFTAADMELAQTIANLLAARIEQARLLDAERRRRQEIEAVYQASLSLAASLEMSEVLDAILSAVLNLLQVQDAHIFLYDGEHLSFAAARTPDGQLRQPYAEPRPAGLTYTVARTGQALFVEDTQRHPMFANVPPDWQPVALAGLPLTIRSGVIGVMNVAYATPRRIPESERRILTLLATQAAIAIQNARLHDQVQRHAEELEQRVAERTRALSDALDRLTELDRLKDQFVSNVSHELRTPLANIKLYLGLLEHGRAEKHEQYLKTLNHETERLEKLIVDLLDLSRIDSGATPVHFMPTDINHLGADLIADRSTQAAERGLTLGCEPEHALPPALADPNLIAQVMSNLVTNAIHYTPRGGSVTFSTGLRQFSQEYWITFTVQDTGPGIPPQEFSHLFERFFRGEAGRRSGEPGAGLGLAICKELVDRHGGRITMDSQPGRGTAFTVWLRPAGSSNS